jgi:hypothetical protein
LEPSREAGGTPVLVMTAHPSLAGLPEALATAGVGAWSVQTRDKLARHLVAARGRCAEVLDATRPVPYSFAAFYHLLHQPPAVSTLVVLLPEGAPPLGSGAVPPLNDFIRLPAQAAEIVLRLQTLLLRAGLAPPATAVATGINAQADPAVPPAAATPPGRDAAASAQSVAEPADRAALAPAASEPPPGVQLNLGTHVFVGQVDPGRRRISDHLNEVARGYLEVADAT